MKSPLVRVLAPRVATEQICADRTPPPYSRIASAVRQGEELPSTVCDATAYSRIFTAVRHQDFTTTYESGCRWSSTTDEEVVVPIELTGR